MSSDSITAYTFRDHFLTGGSPGLATESDNIGLGWYSPATDNFAIQRWPGEVAHPGVVLLSTSTTTDAVDAAMALTGSGSTPPFTASDLQQFRVQVRTGVDIDNMSILVGFGSEGSSASAADDLGTHGVFFLYKQTSNARWQGITRLSSSSTAIVGSGPIVLPNTWYVLEATFNGTQWAFFVNGTSIGTISTTIPTTHALSPICKLRKAATGPASIRGYQLDEYAVRYDLEDVGTSLDTLEDQPSIQPQPSVGQVDGIPVVRVSGGLTVFDYLRCDDVEFGDAGVPIGRYMAAASNDLKTAITAALAANPSKVRFIVPPGSWLISQITEAAGGLRNNLVFDGLDALRCEIKRTTAGGGFIWANAAQNIVFRNITFNIINQDTPFNSLIACGSLMTRALVEKCRFLCTIPNTASDDGIRHQLVFAGSSNVVVRHNYFYRSQCKMAAGGTLGSADGVMVHSNEFEDCNDLGISCVSGDASSLFVKNVMIRGNRFYGTLVGSGFIYVGSDAATTNPDLMADVEIVDNICSGNLGQLGTSASRPASRYGISIALCDVNKRIKVGRNLISNDNPSFDTPIVTAIGLYLRNGISTSSDDISIVENSTDFRSNDPRVGILIDGPNMTGVYVARNIIAAGSRGISMASCSDSDVVQNIVRQTTSTALLLDSSRNAISDLRIRGNRLHAAGSFSSAIQFSGNHNFTRVVAEQNRLVSATGSSAVSGLTGGATLDLAYNYNSHNAGLSGTITPSQNVGNRTE